ncbi:MAG: glycosyltransferase family 2 protein [Clostridia bacterium]|nr:glycosyltransferase family 2 protein [Clostridia bacterium]
MTPIEIIRLVLTILNIIISVLFVLCYAYQYVYAFIALVFKPKPHKPAVLHNFAVLVCARNEEAVIGNLIESLRQQDYPAELTRIFVLADNCTDGTAEVARTLGVEVYERKDSTEVGKGYALNYLLSKLDEDYGKDAFDAYIVFDADNLVDKNFITEINKTYSDGYEVVTSYRNTKNYGANWISAGYGLWFLRDTRLLNQARQILGTCAVVCGTGFLFSRKIKEKNGGWPFHFLTEDTQFTAASATSGEIFGYANDAHVYDEQPTKFSQSWWQRLRWAKGGMQVFKRHGGALFGGIFSKKFATCYDLAMSIAPAFFLSIAAVVVNVVGILVSLIMGDVMSALMMAGGLFVGCYALVFLFGVITTVSEWRHIKARAYKKILYLFTFPIFMFTYIPIAITAIFSRVEWRQIEHTSTERLSDLEGMSKKS